MSVVGALAFGFAVCFGILAVRRTSSVERRLGALASSRRGMSLLRVVREDETAMKIAGAMMLALIAAAASAWLSLGILPIPIAAYLGSIVPSLVAERRRERRERAAERAVITLIEWLSALVASGRPMETALEGITRRGVGDRLLETTLERVRRDYTLGVPMHVALATNGRASRITGLVELATRIERARELGRGALPILEDLRDERRSAERARSLQAASHVDGQLTLVLTLCYLPALALLVIIPLFLTLLAGLFG